MNGFATYQARERLRDGRDLVVRALAPADESGMLAAVGRSSDQSRYTRFFQPRRHFSEKEIDYFINVDFDRHVALVATVDEGGQSVIIGGARYIVGESGSAECAFTVVDQYQGQGIGSILFRHLVLVARQSGLKRLTAEVLASNAPMLGLFRRSGLLEDVKRSGDVAHVSLVL